MTVELESIIIWIFWIKLISISLGRELIACWAVCCRFQLLWTAKIPQNLLFPIVAKILKYFHVWKWCQGFWNINYYLLFCFFLLANWFTCQKLSYLIEFHISNQFVKSMTSNCLVQGCWCFLFLFVLNNWKYETCFELFNVNWVDF